MADKIVYICSNPECNKSIKLGAYSDGLSCPKCGTVLLKECPHCKQFFFELGQSFCIACGKPVKEKPTQKQ